MSTHHDLPKPSAQGERFIALARKVDIARPAETFERKFDELALYKPNAVRLRRPSAAALRKPGQV